jgi:carbamoyltransferase
LRIVAFCPTHDSSVCSIKDGKIEYFCKEERLSKVKRDKNPFLALEKFKSLKLGEIDHFIYHTPTNHNDSFSMWSEYIKKNFNVPLENFSSLTHHLCHAALAHFNSNFKECLVIVVDRDGSLFFINDEPVARETESIFKCDDNFIHGIYKNFSMLNLKEDKNGFVEDIIKKYYPKKDISVTNLGIVQVYEAATTLINQSTLENGKTMGLSAYGKPLDQKLFQDGKPIKKLFEEINNQIYFVNTRHLIKDVEKEDYQFYADKARQVQEQTQEEVFKLIKKYIKKTKIKNVCVVGGYGLNVVANSYYKTKLPKTINFYFEPIADDTGVAIGAAMLKYKEVTGKRPLRNKTTFFHYHNHKYGAPTTKFGSTEIVAKLLQQQKSVGLFCLEPEAGPRALGHRSILFDARNPKAKDIVNQIKKREWYRPFAGVILEKYLPKFFKPIVKKSPHMTMNFEYISYQGDHLFPGILHVDNTSRLQTINGTYLIYPNHYLYEILNDFHKDTKCPVLLNTSFNLAGKPLVQTEEDAVEVFQNSTLDAIYFADRCALLTKEDIK